MSMSLKEEYIAKLDKIPTVSFNKEQKQIAKTIIENTPDKDLDTVYGLITQRVKTGFVFDEAPEVNHNAVTLIKENRTLGINVDLVGKLEHKLIIGENYDALKNLCATYIDKNGKGLIDVIYIDPPYNTEATKEDGNDYKEEVEASKFVYRDKFTRDGWLNMMNERLKLAKRLLSDSGVIFISIDDSEQAYLKVLCDEIFGENNFIANIVWKRKRGRDNSARWFSKAHEYCLVYASKKDNLIINPLELDEGTKKAYTNPDNDYRGPYRVLGCWARGSQSGVKYDFTTKDGQYFKERLWLQSKEKLQQLDEDNKLIIHGDNIYRKMFLYENKGCIPETLWDDVSNAANAADEIKKIFGKIIFDTPKPTPYIKRIIQISSKKNSIILDFFAGSGTTGQAVMELNEEDGGQRKFILVTNNENGIGEKITRERLYRVINGEGSQGEKIDWIYTKEKPYLTNNSVRVFNIETEELTLQDLDKAEKLKDKAKLEFKKLNENYNINNDFDIYNELSALNPLKK